MALQAQDFIRKWRQGSPAFELNERAGAQVHESLDEAVADAYDWADYTPAMADEEILRRLLALNLERAAS